MTVEPWYKLAILRKEVRAGRSFNPDEFAIALEQVVAKTAPEDYHDPAQFSLVRALQAASLAGASLVLPALATFLKQLLTP
jgi:hypothetical protein